MKALSADQLTVAENLLKPFFPQSLQVYGYIFQLNRVRSEPLDVLVDKWPDFTTVICKPRVEKEGDLFKDMCVFTKHEDTLRKILVETDVLNWTVYFSLAVDLCHEDMVMALAAQRGVPGGKVAVCHVMKLQDPCVLPKVASPPLKMSALDESHVDLVNRFWKFGREEHSAQMIRSMIRHFPSCCLQDEDGQAVAWILMYASCALGMLYTVPEHRGKGHATVLICALSKRLHAQGYPVYCFIEEENRLSYRLFKNLGFTEDPAYRATWLDFNQL